jgi:hypothetical protein
MAMKGRVFLNPFAKPIEVEQEILEEEEEGGDYLFDPEAGKASDNPFAHLAMEDAPEDSAVSEDEEVSKYVAGEEE